MLRRVLLSPKVEMKRKINSPMCAQKPSCLVTLKMRSSMSSGLEFRDYVNVLERASVRLQAIL